MCVTPAGKIGNWTCGMPKSLPHSRLKITPSFSLQTGSNRLISLPFLSMSTPKGSGVLSLYTRVQWQAMWYSGAFGATFRSVSGSLVEVIQFGFWNREPGPDFVHASIRIDGGQILEGDVEFDMHVADWERHGHSQNPAFDG